MPAASSQLTRPAPEEGWRSGWFKKSDPVVQGEGWLTAAGTLAPSQGAQLLGALSALARVVEIDELVSRVDALEKAHAKA